MKRLSIDLDERTYKKFSIKCAKVGKRKAEIIRELIQRWLKDKA